MTQNLSSYLVVIFRGYVSGCVYSVGFFWFVCFVYLDDLNEFL